jgi:NAD dependent epimerase/dehydratase family enzyme
VRQATGFLPEVCVAWERATGQAEAKGIRTIHPRFGIILDEKGGALERMLTPFRMGVGGKVGNGKQWMSWIALEDVINALRFLIDEPGK